MRKKILIITSYFFPDIQIAAIRLESIIKHLVSNEWDVFICTSGENNDPPWGQMQVIRINEPLWDVFKRASTNKKSLQSSNNKGNHVNPKMKVLKKIKAFFKKVIFSCYYLYRTLFWSKLASTRLKGIIASYGIDKILVTAPGIETLLAGAMLKKHHKNAELIVEIRDILAYCGFNDNRLKINHFIDRLIESKCNKFVDKYVFLTSVIKQHYEGFLPIRKSAVITNGISLVNNKVNEKWSKDQLVISHTGFFYGNRHPLLFLKALGEILNEEGHMHFREQIKIILAGQIVEEILEPMGELIRQYDLDTIVEYRGVISHEDAIRLEFLSDINLLITHQKGSEYAIPGKLFEYIGARRPILAITEDQLVLNMIDENGLGWHASNNDIAAIQEILRYLISRYDDIKNMVVDKDVVQKYSRENVNRVLEQFMLE